MEIKELDLPVYDLPELMQQAEEDLKDLEQFAEDNKTYITKRETAEILGVSERTVDNYVKHGYIHRYKVERKKKLYFEELEVIDLKYKMVHNIPFSDEVNEIDLLEKYKSILRVIAGNPVGESAIYEIYNEIF